MGKVEKRVQFRMQCKGKTSKFLLSECFSCVCFWLPSFLTLIVCEKRSQTELVDFLFFPFFPLFCFFCVVLHFS